MRTTIELSDEQHRALMGLARRRHLRGFSLLVQEAVDAYLSELGTDERDVLLSLEGSLTANDEQVLRGRIEELRSLWRAQ